MENDTYTDEANRQPAADLAMRISVYLLGHGWFRDGDDPAIWVKEGHDSVSLTDALAIQFVEEGLEWPVI